MTTNENTIQYVKHKANWFIVIGVILIVLGCLALGYQFMVFLNAILINAKTTMCKDAS